VFQRVLRGRYRLDEVIDEGASATVWRARDTQLDRAVAIKVLDRPGLEFDTAEQIRFRDEARALARLSHPHIVTVFDSGTEDGAAFLIMELVDGRSVRSRLAEEGVLPVAEAVAITTQVCEALAAAHAAGIVHRDIKPGNIVVTADGTAKVCDFGIARLNDATPLTDSDIALGTSSYMAPEQISGQAVDRRADLYAVGCLLFEMLAGAPPYVGETAFSIADQHVHAPPPSLRSRRPDVPAGIERLVERLLAKDPGLRPGTAAQVQAELVALTATDPDAVVVARTLTTRRGRHRFAWAGMVAAAVVVTIPVHALVAQPGSWPESWFRSRRAAPPAAIAPPNPSSSPYPDPSPVPSADSLPLPTQSPGPAVSPTVRTVPAIPGPAPLDPSPPAARSPLEQTADLRALVRDLEGAGQLPAKNADELDHLLNDVANLIGQGKTREARDKVAATRKKNDDLLRDSKISAEGHAALDAGLVRLAGSI